MKRIADAIARAERGAAALMSDAFCRAARVNEGQRLVIANYA